MRGVVAKRLRREAGGRGRVYRDLKGIHRRNDDVEVKLPSLRPVSYVASAGWARKMLRSRS